MSNSLRDLYPKGLNVGAIWNKFHFLHPDFLPFNHPDYLLNSYLFPNQVNNLLAFPGVFRGALDAGAREITEKMKLAAALALAACVLEPTVEKILPDPLEKEVATKIAEAVRKAAE